MMAENEEHRRLAAEHSYAPRTHLDSGSDMSSKGRDLEKVVLSRAVCWHLGNRILVYQNKTVVFI
jgi:formyltetrahydrofolate deformylase